MATPTANTVALTGIALVDGLTHGSSWVFSGPRVLTYSLNINFAYDNFGGVIPGPGGNWTPELSAALARALSTWSDVANIGFQQIASGSYSFESGADIAAALTGDELQTSLGAIGLGLFPDPNFGSLVLDLLGLTRSDYPRPEGDVYFDNYYGGYSYLYAGGYGFEALVHEIGHVLGLKHPEDDGASGRPTFTQLGIAALDTERHTVMTNNESALSLISGHVASPMPLDILAIQRIYGANMAYRAGDDVYAITSNLNNPLATIWDAGGIDSFDASNYAPSFSHGLVIDLRPGTGFGDNLFAADGFTAIAYNVTIENATGSPYNDTLIGNDAANTLSGGGANDSIVGGPGNDFVAGNLGNDILFGGGGDDFLVAGGPGIDTVFGGEGNDNVQGNAEEDFVYGGNGDDSVFGGHGNDSVFGEAGNDTLDGILGADTLLGGDGADVMTGGSDTLADIVFGGSGDDSLVGGPAGDFVAGNADDDTVRGGEGMDNVQGNLGNDSVFGGNGNDSVFGGGDHDQMFGEAGLDTLMGGLGSDTLSGGSEADRFWFTSFGATNADTVTDYTAGTDAVQLDAVVFTMLASLGTQLPAGNFVSAVGATAADADDFVLYDTATGALSYDADGSGAGAAEPVATFSGASAIAAAAIFIA